MEFQIFRLIWMLFIPRIYTNHFTISEVKPKKIKICIGTDLRGSQTWTIHASLSGITSDVIYHEYYSQIAVDVNFNYNGQRCRIDIDDGDQSMCPPPPRYSYVMSFRRESDYVCYCYGRINDRYDLNITKIAFIEDNNSMLKMELLRYSWSTFSRVEYKIQLPVTIEASTCFGTKHQVFGVKQTEQTINAGDTWDAQVVLTITDADNSRYENVVQFKEDTLPFCEIDIRNNCTPIKYKTPPNGDRFCYCYVKNYNEMGMKYYTYRLKVIATAKESQSQRSLTAELLSTTGGPAITGTIGTLPTIIEPTIETSPTITEPTSGTLPTIIEQSTSTTKSQGTTTEEETTEEETTEASPSNVWLILILSGLERFCFSVVLWYFNKYRKRTGTSEDGRLETETLKKKQANCETVSDSTARPKRMKGKTSGSAVFIDSDTCQHSRSQSVSDDQTTSTSSVKK